MTPTDPLPWPAASGRLPPPGPPNDATTGFADGGDIDPPPGYVIEREVGRSAAGDIVYYARREGSDEPVCLRLLHRLNPLQTSRVQRIAGVLAQVDHPNVERVYEVDEHAGCLFIASEYLPDCLAARLTAGPVPQAEAADLLASVAQGLHAAHTAGLVHRCVMPANILFTADGRAKVADFWLARTGPDDLPEPDGVIIGNPAHMAPEQVVGDHAAVGPAADVWAAGVTLYRCLTGRLPWSSDSACEMLRQIIDAAPVPPRKVDPAVDRGLEAICRKCLQARPADRYPTAAALADDLTRWRTGRPVAVAGGRVRRALAWVRGR